MDAITQEFLELEVGTGFASWRATPVLDEIVARRGCLQPILCDNGPELMSRRFLAWAPEWKIGIRGQVSTQKARRL